MKRELKARLERLAPVQGVSREKSGSRVVLILRPAGDLADVRTIDATHALARYGASLLKAKRAVEAMVHDGSVAIELPCVPDRAQLADELERAGLDARERRMPEPVNVKALRERLGMTQKQFALRFGLRLATLQGWEQGRKPDPAATVLLHLIERNPVLAGGLLEASLVASRRHFRPDHEAPRARAAARRR